MGLNYHWSYRDCIFSFILALTVCVLVPSPCNSSPVDDRHETSSNKITVVQSQRLPDAIIIGTRKSGTRALLTFLNQHPEIMSCGREIHFFDRNYHRGLKWYLQQMPSALNSQIVMEKTPAYFVGPNIPARVYMMNHKIKLFLVVRNPVSRIISDYTQMIMKDGIVGTFEENILINNSKTGRPQINTSWKAVKFGHYADYLTAWLNYFPMEQIHIISGEELVDNPVKVLKEAEKFLNLKPVISESHFYFNPNKGFYCLKKRTRSGRPDCLGKSKGRTHVKIPPYVKDLLFDYYRERNEKFFKMVRRDFGWNDHPFNRNRL